MFNLGFSELALILVILLLLFGSTRLPKLARSIGESAGELQKGFDGAKSATKKTEKSAETSDAS